MRTATNAGRRRAFREAATRGGEGLVARRAWREIEVRGFARWEAQQGSVPAGWRRALGEERIEQLVADLGATGDGCVLGHGDHQPRHLLRWLTPAERDVVTAAYLEAMQRRGLLCEVSAARGASLAASGLRLDHLIAAKQMVRKLGRACRPGHLRTFRASLDALVAGVV